MPKLPKRSMQTSGHVAPSSYDQPANQQIYLGIDPGAGGGIAIIHGNKVSCYPMPDTETDLWNVIEGVAEIMRLHYGGFALLEQVGGFVGKGEGEKGGGRANGSAMFKFGANYGDCRMALVASGIPHERWPPAKWLKFLGIPNKKKGETRSEWKNRLKGHAQQLFPQVKVTLATADALLIAEACRRFRQGISSSAARYTSTGNTISAENKT